MRARNTSGSNSCDQETYQAGGIEILVMVMAGRVDTVVIGAGTEVIVESCTMGGSVCVVTLILTDTDVVVTVL